MIEDGFDVLTLNPQRVNLFRTKKSSGDPEAERMKSMSKLLVGVFVVTFIGALVYEILNRTKPELTEKIETKVSQRLDSLLSPA